jgi:hypothetical protein
MRDIAIWAVGDTVGSLLSTVYFIQSPDALIVTDWELAYVPPIGLNTGADSTGRFEVGAVETME